jgi:hypothetical protein
MIFCKRHGKRFALSLLSSVVLPDTQIVGNPRASHTCSIMHIIILEKCSSKAKVSPDSKAEASFFLVLKNRRKELHGLGDDERARTEAC